MRYLALLRINSHVQVICPPSEQQRFTHLSNPNSGLKPERLDRVDHHAVVSVTLLFLRIDGFKDLVTVSADADLVPCKGGSIRREMC